MAKYKGADLSNLTFNTEMKKIMPKTSVITRAEALEAAKSLASLVREQVDPEALVFVFGSAIKGTADLQSDIDVAVVSKIFDGDLIFEAGRVSGLAYGVNEDIEIHAVANIDWKKGNPHVLEIQRWGVPI